MHKRVKTIIACLFISFAVLPVQLDAQDEQHGDHDHNAYRNEIGAGPGISYFSHHDEFLPSGHIETGYEFEAGQVHFGPVLEYSIAGEEQHFMFGLHLGVPF
ncbi:MAG: hypothetical protein RQ761_07815 [Bacteroidales bacterium]|nr:hypothetical protein [Bacteroidales bacterium]